MNAERILAVKLGAMGDLVIASSFFHHLRRQFPKAEIVLLTGKTYGQVLNNHPVFDRLILADDYKLYRGGAVERLKELFRLIAVLRKERFGLAFVLHRAWQFNLLVLLSGIPRRVGYSRGREGIGLTDCVTPVPFRNERESYLDLLRVMGLPAIYERSYYYLSPEENRFLDDFLEQNNIRADEALVGIAPGGGKNVKSYMPTRRWPVQYFVQLTRKLLEHNCRVVLLGGRDEKDLAEKIMSECPACIDALSLSYGEMASVLRRCQLYVGNDSGPLHIADAMGATTLSLYGPTDPRVQAPLGGRSNVFFKHIECSPCYSDGDFPPCGHVTCLNAITPDEVWERAKSILGRQE